MVRSYGSTLTAMKSSQVSVVGGSRYCKEFRYLAVIDRADACTAIYKLLSLIDVFKKLKESNSLVLRCAFTESLLG